MQNTLKRVHFAEKSVFAPNATTSGIGRDLRQTEAMGSTKLKRISGASIAVSALLLVAATSASAYTRDGGQGARMLQPSKAFKAPGQTKVIARIAAETPLTGGPLVLPIVSTTTFEGAEWLRVRLAGRPNGQTGWIPASAVQKVTLHWRILIDTGSRVMLVFHDGKRSRRLRVVVGARSTPTPTGHYSVMERVRLGTSWSRYGWALALSAFSNVLKHFDGGEGQVAIHARGSLEGDLGTAASHGCVRVRDADASWLAHRIPNGTAVDIQR